MSKKFTIALAVALVAFLGTSFAAVENIKVSGDLTTQGISRNLSLGQRAELGVPGVNDLGIARDAEDFIFSQVRIRFDADLTEGVSATVRLLNERIWGGDNDNTTTQGSQDSETAVAGDTDISLDLAYLELKEFLYEPLTVIVGRQNLRYGNAMIIGDPDTNLTASAKVSAAIADQSKRKSFDAIRTILDYSPYTVDSFYAKLEENVLNSRDDVNVMGTNVSYDWSSYNGVSEVYLMRQETTLGVEGGNTTVGATRLPTEEEDYINVVGGRVQFDPNDNLTFGLEGAYQFGDVDGSIAQNNLGNTGTVGDDTEEPRSAWAAQAIGQYRFLNDYNAQITGVWSFFSGDDDPADSDYNAWDPMCEDQIPAEIMNYMLPQSNIQYFSLNASMMPREDITVGLLYARAWLVEQVYATATGLNDPTIYTVGAGPAAGNSYIIDSSEKALADEWDAYASYDYTEDVQFNLTAAFLNPGSWMDEENDAIAYSVRGGVSVDF